MSTIFNIIATGTIEELEPFVKANPHCLEDHSGIFADKLPPLSYALQLNKIDFAIKLLALGANPNLKDGKKNTALHMVAENGNTEVLKLILSYKDLDINAFNEYKDDALAVAIYAENSDAAILLIDAGIQFNTNKDQYDYSAIHKAADKDNFVIYKKLLDAGANRYVKNSSKKTPELLTDNEQIHMLHNTYFPNINMELVLPPPSSPAPSAGFIKENECAVSLTKVFEASASTQKIIYDFSDKSITTITTETDGKVQTISGFDQAANKTQLQNAAKFLNDNNGQLHGFPIAQIL